MAETLSPNFMIEHLLQGLYGVDAPSHFSAPLPKPHNWFQGGGGGFASEGGKKRIWEKVAEGEGRKETEREREPEGERKGTGNGNSSLVAGNRRLYQWGPGGAPAEKRISCI